MRLLGAALIIAASLISGLYFSRTLRTRYESLEKCIAALVYLKTHICVLDVNMYRALNDAETACGVLGIFSEAAQNMRRDGLRDAWRTAVAKQRGAAGLTEKDAEILASLGDRLGSTDADSQRKSIDAVCELLHAQAEEARTEYEKKGKLYGSCPLLCGIVAVLLFF